MFEFTKRRRTIETGPSCAPTSIAPFRAGPFKFSRCNNFAVATSSDKRARVQTGRSVQLQDASVGGPRGRMQSTLHSQEMHGLKGEGYHFVTLRRSFNTTSHTEREKRSASLEARTNEFSATCLLGNIARLIQGSLAFLVSMEATRLVCKC